jgi:predicted nucleic acid-binding protein
MTHSDTFGKPKDVPWANIADNYCPSSDEIVSAGREIMEHGVKSRDALHISCAIKSGCDFFITTDKGLLNKTIANITIINPIDFVRETEEHHENG